MELFKYGRRIYADKLTGVILYNSGEVTTTMPDYREVVNDWESIKALIDRTPESVIVIELEVGELEQDFQEGELVRVNPGTSELEFVYSNPSGSPEEPPKPTQPLSEQISLLASQNETLTDYILDVDLRLLMVELGM